MKTIVLVLRSGGDFTYKDVALITDHIYNKWKGSELPQVLCLWDKVAKEIKIGRITLLPITNTFPGTWSRIQLYSPEMEKYKPFLYIDLDTAVINSIENVFSLVYDETHFITLEDFWQKGQIATGLVWFPANCKATQNVWNAHLNTKKTGAFSFRMDPFIRKHAVNAVFWQNLTTSILDFKPKDKKLLSELPENADLVCFHGKPRIPNATGIKWVYNYVHKYDGKGVL